MQDTECTERIKKMEEYFDELLEVLDKGPDALAEKTGMLHALREYYEGGLWLSDYEADERGEIPPELKRGVLSEDGVYNLLCELENM